MEKTTELPADGQYESGDVIIGTTRNEKTGQQEVMVTVFGPHGERFDLYMDHEEALQLAFILTAGVFEAIARHKAGTSVRELEVEVKREMDDGRVFDLRLNLEQTKQVVSSIVEAATYVSALNGEQMQCVGPMQ
jgi:hypothetical protein